MKRLIKTGLIPLICAVSQGVAAQWLTQSSGTIARLRGVSAVSATVAWASGSNGVYLKTTDGGATWQVATTPIPSGLPSVSIFSIAFKDARNGCVVGGDYKKEGEARDNVATTSDGGRRWKLAKGSLPSGFRSAVAYAPGASTLVAVGPSGSDFSLNGGASWAPIAGSGYHAISFARSGPGWAVGEGGRITKYLNQTRRLHQ